MGEKVKGVISYKRALIGARAIMNDKALESERAEKFVSDITPFLNKRTGELKKNLSKKQIAEFNQKVSQYKSSGVTSKSAFKAAKRKQLESFTKDNSIISSENSLKVQKAHQQELINTFKLKTVQNALKSGLITSDQVVTMKQTYKKVTGTAIVNAARAAKKQKERETPEEAKFKAQADDYTGLIHDILASKLEQITEEDIPF